jgi:hypothetical protein
MRIVPYSTAHGVPFGASEESVVSILGSEFQKKLSREGLIELVYEAYTFRLSRDEQVLVEATLDSEYFEIEGCRLHSTKKNEISFVEMGYAVAKLDNVSFEAHGFIVSPKFGVAFDPHFPSWLTVFAKGELNAWRNLA